jgi:Contractile injection system tube protein
MERVAFLIEDTGERLGALLNPASLLMRRVAGVSPRRSISGPLSGAGLSDDPLLYTGGGRTELELELLFDVSVAGSSLLTGNVRELTAPLWELAENKGSTISGGYGRPRLVRFVWGKTWNVLGVVSAVAERLEQFNAEGAPQRSWLRMRLVRVSEPVSPAGAGDQPMPDLHFLPEDLSGLSSDNGCEDTMQMHEVVCGGEDEPWELGDEEEVEEGDDVGLSVEADVSIEIGEGETFGEVELVSESQRRPGAGERLEEIAIRYYGESNAHLWRLIAACNDIDDPTHLPCGTVLKIPALTSLETSV